MSSIHTLTQRPPEENPNIRRISEDIDPDLFRTSQGIRVECHFTPMLKRPTHAVVSVYDHTGRVLLDQGTFPAEEGYERWQHTAVWSARYAEAVR